MPLVISQTGGRQVHTAAKKLNTTPWALVINYFTQNAKLVLYYATVVNEKTALAGFTQDVKDNVFTCRLQFRF